MRSDDPNYADRTRRFADGSLMITTHFGWGGYHEGCLNSPLREETRSIVRQVAANYPVGLIYYDRAYQGMNHEADRCHCRYCREAYWKARGRDVPRQDGAGGHHHDKGWYGDPGKLLVIRP